MAGTTYDAGALIAADAGDKDMWETHLRLLKRCRPVVPTVVLAQAWRGGPQPRLSRLLKDCTIESFEERHARAAGTALAASGGSDIVDAAVVVSALERDDEVVSSDPDDLRRIAAASAGASPSNDHSAGGAAASS